MFARLHLGEPEKELANLGNGRFLGERRKSERRNNEFPLQDREKRLRFAARTEGFGTDDPDCLTGDPRDPAGLHQDNRPLAIEQILESSHPEGRERFLAALPPDDRTQLAQVQQNRIDYAIKYHGGREPPRVPVSARREGGQWVFSVRDNGIGIADKHLEQISDIFRRLHSQQEYPGTGSVFISTLPVQPKEAS